MHETHASCMGSGAASYPTLRLRMGRSRQRNGCSCPGSTRRIHTIMHACSRHGRCTTQCIPARACRCSYLMWTRRHLDLTSTVQAHACLVSQHAHGHARNEYTVVVRLACRRCCPGCSSSLILKKHHGTTTNAWPLSVCSACKHVALTSCGSSAEPPRHPDEGPGWSTGHSGAAAECDAIAADDPQPAAHRDVQHHVPAVHPPQPHGIRSLTSHLLPPRG
jgi:hypothetical protein